MDIVTANNDNLILPSSNSESTVRDYISLLKPRVMSLVVFTALISMLIAPGNIHPFIGSIAILCIALGSGAAGAINMWYDRDIDIIMQRTRHRPLPRGVIDPANALEFGVCLSALSVFMMGIVVNYLSAVLLLAAILFYVFIYTIWLKRLTPQNIVIGGAAGSFPPMIGWAAVTNNITLESIILFLIIFIWTPPHFWALALYKSADYKLANIPMMPITNGVKSTKNQIMIYSVIMTLVTFLPYYINLSGKLYFIIALILGGIFCIKAYNLMKSPDIKHAPSLFGYSIIYLFILYFGLLIDKYIYF